MPDSEAGAEAGAVAGRDRTLGLHPRRHVVVSIRATEEEVGRWKSDAAGSGMRFAPWMRDALDAWAGLSGMDKVAERPESEFARKVAREEAGNVGSK